MNQPLTEDELTAEIMQAIHGSLRDFVTRVTDIAAKEAANMPADIAQKYQWIVNTFTQNLLEEYTRSVLGVLDGDTASLPAFGLVACVHESDNPDRKFRGLRPIESNMTILTNLRDHWAKECCRH